uniref:pyruvate dehydrogenase phosphatase regulatory subunit, mitochondrial n=1 Tax=Myxine glutinosa TaxID=7769 RepID=UPI00358FDB76
MLKGFALTCIWATGRRAAVQCGVAVRCYGQGSTQGPNGGDDVPSLPAHAKVVICGGGIVGTSVAYHLAKLGWKDVLLLEQGRLHGGTTLLCAGIVTRARHIPILSQMADYSCKLYSNLQKETGVDTGFHQTGSLSLAQSEDRLLSLKWIASHLQVNDIPCSILSSAQVAELHPWVETADLHGALHVPVDGVINPVAVCRAFAHAAIANGVRMYDRTAVSHAIVEKGMVTAVETDRGMITCEYFVNCAGQWAYELGQSCDEPVSIPLHPCEHFYLITQPAESPLASDLPVVLDPDGRIYVRPWNGGILSGGFEKNPKPICTEGKNQVEFQNLQHDWDHYGPLLQSLLERMPVLSDVHIRRLVNCPESFSPDMRCILGESPSVRNYFVLAGMNSSGTSLAGGAGRLLAEWIAFGSTSVDVWPMDIRRFSALQGSRTFLRHRVMEVVPLLYERLYHGVEFQTGRRLRTSPLYDRLDSQGARWTEKHAFERPKYFVTEGQSDGEQNVTFYKPSWFDIVRNEVMACKEAVCAIDMSSFTKFELRSAGRQALDMLQWLCCDDMDVPTGTVVHTGMLNANGAYENDCSIARLSKGNFFIVSSTDQHIRCWAWLSRHLPADGSVQLEDVTWKYTALNVIGPLAVSVLSDLSYIPISQNQFPSMTCKEMSMGYATGIRAISTTHTGEPGFVLYIPIEYALYIYNEMMGVGKKHGIQNAGYFALRSLRIERFFPFWGQDLNSCTTPLECGRENRVKFDEDIDFLGRKALLQQKQDGVRRRLMMLILIEHSCDEDPWPHGHEPIFRNNQFVGFTTSCDYSFSLKGHVCLGYVQHRDATSGQLLSVIPDYVTQGDYELEIAGMRYKAKARLYPVPLPNIN